MTAAKFSAKTNYRRLIEINSRYYGLSLMRTLTRGPYSVRYKGEGKTGVPGEKPLGAKERTNNKLNPHMVSTTGFEPGPHW